MALTTQHFATRRKVVNILPPKDITGGATKSHIDIFSLKGYDKATIILTFGVVNASTTAAITLEKCTDVAGTGNTAITFSYRSETTAGGDTLDAGTTSASLSVSVEDGTIYVIEVRAEELLGGTTTNYDCLSLLISCSAHSTLASAVAVLEGSRYQNGAMPTAIID